MNIESLSEYQAYFYNAQIIVTAVMVLICLFAFVNLLNTCIPNTVIRRHDYALLEAAGMTKVQIYQTQNAEILIYFLGSLIGSCVVGIPLGFLICNKIAEIPGLSYISYQFPWLFLLLYFVLRPRSGTRFPPGRWKTGARRSRSVLSSGRSPSISPLPYGLRRWDCPNLPQCTA